jgi:hypothetical protein
VYADDGVYTATVCVIDDDGASACDTFTVLVNNVAPTLTAGSDQAVGERQTVSLAPATFNDLGTLDTHTATINWGDGTRRWELMVQFLAVMCMPTMVYIQLLSV